ncbi:2OG-Fe(II) oxygenase [Planomonospora parontospora]|uniref:2OG-Fe(II) oxygenase n=1 Tax=Planomonospora parontospora TaxID=58119 RepID=UPI00194503FC|nr:2OG-Fe(II) oxygenase [Planomonospora parontospora]
MEQPAAASVYRKLFMSDLSVSVEGVGPLKFPVGQEQVGQLRELGRRARFGRGTETLTDPRVRDTWEIPTELVRLEWTDAFAAVLEVMREELGLPAHCTLTPKLHSVLLYETGQFFVTHQDSEKDDDMVATLVVTLPSAHTGGELVLEHNGQTIEYRGSKVAVSLVAFYADCRHQVLPVTSGNRITLTYNLLLTGDSGTAPETALTGELAACLDTHFATPVILPYSGGPADPPSRLAYLLDHEYTARGLNWSRLKGADAARAALLRTAAGQAGYEVTLALAEIQETWDAYDEDEDDYYYQDEEDDDEAEERGDEQYVIQDLIDSSITLSHWIDPKNGRLTEISLALQDAETATSTPSADLTPYTSQYEGYMGNYGNTLDRWYRRAALVIWPRNRGFASQAEASALWALNELGEILQGGAATEARDAALTLAPFWQQAVTSGPKDELLARALDIAPGLDDGQTSAMLLAPFQLQQMVAAHAASLAALTAHYGDLWLRGLLRDWSRSLPPKEYGYVPDDLIDWLSALPELISALQETGTAVAHHLLEPSWAWFSGRVRSELTGASTASREEWLTSLGRPFSGLLIAAAQCESTAVLEGVGELVRTSDDQVVRLVTAALRAAETSTTASHPVFDQLAANCADRIRTALARPLRAHDDWSIELPSGCSCELCETLETFLRDPQRRIFEWKLATGGRSHVHGRIDLAELPVRHQTRREGRPYTLVLTKTDALFDRERLARTRDEEDLTWLTLHWNVTA